jgi:HlyD family secretion protein
VNYVVIISVDDARDWLKPDMSVDLNIEVARCRDGILVPNAALRFRPPIGVAQVVEQTKDLTWPELPEAVEVSDSAVVATDSPDADVQPPIPIRQRVVVWKYDGQRYEPVPVWTGITDHRFTQVLAGDLKGGDQVVTEVQTADQRNILQKMASMAPGGTG